MLLSLYRSTYITIFNKDMFTDASQPFLYEHVENGTWTLNKQISSVQFFVPYYHLSTGVTETNCIAPYYVDGKNLWTLPDFRAMSAPLWAGQPQHTSGGRLYFLRRTSPSSPWMDGRGVVYDTLGYLDESNEVVITDTNKGQRKKTYKLGSQSPFVSLSYTAHRGVRERCVGGLQHRLPKRLRRLHGPLRRRRDLLLLIHYRHERRRPRIQSSAVKAYHTRRNAGFFVRSSCEHTLSDRGTRGKSPRPRAVLPQGSARRGRRRSIYLRGLPL